MSTLAKNGNRVLFIENTGVRSPGIKDIPRLIKRIKNYSKGAKGIRKEGSNLYVLSPIILPFPYSWIARRINRFMLLSILERWMKVLGFVDPIIWVYLPTGITLDIIANINKKLTVYYCTDNFSISSSYAKKVKITESKLLKKCDLVFTTSKALYDYCCKFNSNVTVFPSGVTIESFQKARLLKTAIPDELKGIRGTIVGYIGGVHKWIDQGLVKTIALNFPDFAFVFVGPLQTDISALSNIKNIYFIGNKSHEELPYLVKYFSVTIIPYVINEYTENVYPSKLNEYLCMGKPVVSTNLPEIRIFNQRYDANIVYIAKTVNEFCAHIRNAIAQDDDSLRQRRIEIAMDNNWQNRIEQMSGIIEKSIEKKMRDIETKWRENFLILYRKIRNKSILIVSVLALAYVFIFYTPIIWFLAEPLKIAQVSQKADAIVVFAGGVGESGKAGEGYEERVQYAAELYNKGYAKHLIFSSGYMYIYKEPLLMKVLAVSLGIPESAIILEENAANTYENVKLVTKILEQNGWANILLVSSPYHMRRASLVFNKIAKEINVYYAPTPKSIFYSHEDKDRYGRKIWQTINLQQIRGIFHEYLGIVYYWYKGRI